MADHARLSRTRRRLATVATATALALAAPVTAASSANAQSGPVPDFNSKPPCVSDILAISCFVEGTATGGGQNVSWDWEYPGFLGDHASGQSTVLRFETSGTFTVTLTVTDDQDRTGSVTKPMVVNISAG
jgi:PKD repeat protein